MRFPRPYRRNEDAATPLDKKGPEEEDRPMIPNRDPDISPNCKPNPN